MVFKLTTTVIGSIRVSIIGAAVSPIPKPTVPKTIDPVNMLTADRRSWSHPHAPIKIQSQILRCMWVEL